jgi:TRAP-type C4-dicarboxylate transport system substrate-binding protein
MDGGVGDVVRDAIGRPGSPMKKIWDNGFRQITSSSSRQLNGVEDLRGFKIRVPVTALLTSLFSGLGALPSSISYSELYSALQTHIVEGQENPLAQVSTGKLYEVQKYCALSNHCWSGYWIVGNRRALAGLPADFRCSGFPSRASPTGSTAATSWRSRLRSAHETIVAGALERNQRLLGQLGKDEVAGLLEQIDRLTGTAAKMLDAEKRPELRKAPWLNFGRPSRVIPPFVGPGRAVKIACLAPLVALR